MVNKVDVPVVVEVAEQEELVEDAQNQDAIENKETHVEVGVDLDPPFDVNDAPEGESDEDPSEHGEDGHASVLDRGHVTVKGVRAESNTFGSKMLGANVPPHVCGLFLFSRELRNALTCRQLLQGFS